MTRDGFLLQDEKMRAEISKLIADTKIFSAQTILYPAAIATGLIVAVATATRLFL